MEKVRKISKEYYLKEIMCYWLVFYMLFCFGMPMRVAWAPPPPTPTPVIDGTAGPDGFAYGAGSVLQGVNGNAWTNVTVQKQENIIHWKTINTIGGEDLNYLQDGVVNANVLNRVTGGVGTEFYGNLNAEQGMSIWVLNPAGILFGGTATINVTNLVASSLDIDNADFLNGMPYTFTGGATAGDVMNRSTDITAERLYLIGRRVGNRGALVADDYVVMAAGETVFISENSPVVVEVSMPEQTPGSYDYIVDNGGLGAPMDCGSGDIEADHVILAAGDIWSAAIDNVETLRAEAKGNAIFDGEISAYAESASDAVADVTIITGGDFTVDDEIMAEAEATGGGDNAFATVTIESTGGDVTINERVRAEADAEAGAGNATATVDIIAIGDVTINDVGALGWDGDYVVKADTWVDENSGNATANLNITSLGGDVDIYDDVSAQADTRDGSGNAISKAEITAHEDVYTDDNFKSRAEAVDSGNATADTIITAEDIEFDGQVNAHARTDNSGDAVGNVEITARGDLDIDSRVKSYAESINGSGNATSDVKITGVDIDIDGEVKSKTESYEGGDATSDIKITGVNIDIYSNVTSRALSEDSSGNATAGVDIDASGSVYVDDRVRTHASVGWDGTGNSGNATATTKIVGTDITIEGGGGSDSLSVSALAETYDNSGNANANVELEATTGDVIIDTDGYPVMAEAYVENPADSHATAGVTITAAEDVEIYDLVKAEADAEDGAGNVTATVDIVAGDDVDIEDDITAEAEADGGFNAIAGVTIEAGGYIEIDSDGSSTTEIKAKAKDGLHNYADVIIEAVGDVDILARNGDVRIKAEADPDGFEPILNVANIEITGENVTIQSENSGWGDDEALIHAYAHDGGQNKANVSITANGEESGDVLIESEEGWQSDDAIVKAEAKNGEDNLATVDISATGNVEVKAYGFLDDDDVLVKAEAWNELELDPEIPVPEGEEEVVVDLAVEGLTNTATVDITAGGYVEIYGYGSGDAGVEAVARNMMEVDIDNYDNEVTVNLTVADLENTAGVTITAEGEGVSVEADGSSAKVGIAAQAYNELEIEHKGYRHRRKTYPVEPATVNLTVEGLVNTADIDITADNGNVEVGTDEDWFSSEAVIYADAWNDFEMDFDETTTANLDFDGIANTADIGITAGYDVEVIAKDGGESGIAASAFNELDTDGDAIWTTTADNITNDAGVIVDAVEGSVIVKAECEGDCSDAYIEAVAWNEGDILEDLEVEPENITNNADVVITAGEDVKVIAKDCGDARIVALTHDGIDNTSTVTINADGDVLVHGIGGKYSRRSGFTPSSASIEAIAEDAGNKNTADIAITTGTEEDTGDVKVIAVKGGIAFIEATAQDAWSEDSENEATVDIDAHGDVVVKADGYGSGPPSEAFIVAVADNAGNKNTADVTIDATAVAVTSEEEICDEVFEYTEMEGGNVEVMGIDSGIAGIGAYAAWANDSENTANVTITAVGGDVLVHAIGGRHSKNPGFESSQASIEAEAEGAYGDCDEDSGKNTANVTIKTTAVEVTNLVPVFTDLVTAAPEPPVFEEEVEVYGGDVKVIAVEGGEAEIKAIAKDAEGFVEKGDDGLPVEGPENPSNTADIKICADGDVKVKALGWGSGPDSEAEIKAVTVDGFSNTSNILICAEDVEVVGGTDWKERGEASILALAHLGHLNNAYVGINARGDLDVLAWRGEASIESIAMMGHTNTAYTHICAEDVLVEALKRSEAEIEASADDGKFNTADIDIVSRGNVKVIARNRSEAEIEASAKDGSEENNARVGIWADGDVIVRGVEAEAEAEIEAEATNDCEGTDNTAKVTVVAGGDIRVTAVYDGEAEIGASAKDGSNLNNAYVGLWTDGDVQVAGYEGGDAEITAEAKDGVDNDATVAVCAEGDVIVAAGFDPKNVGEGIPKGTGGTATIKAEAQADSEWETVLVWNEDTQKFDEVRVETSATANVKVVSHDGGVAVIDVTGDGQPADTAFIEADAHNAYYNDAYAGVAAYGDLTDEENPFYEEGLSVFVAGFGESSEAYISANAENGVENTADTVVCTPGEVAVETEGGEAYIWAHTDDGDIGTATTQIYATGVYVSDGDARIGADTPGGEVYVTGFEWSSGDGAYLDSEEGSTLIIDDYGQRKDCPECDPRPLPPDCPLCELVAAFLAAPPLPQVQIPTIEGCPQLVQAAAMELGITAETIQVGIGGALALNPTIQPCEACATLVDAASILRDEDGSRMAAMVQTFNALAPADAPFTPATAASVAMAFEGAAEGSQYASAMEYIDAFVQYVAVLDTGLGSPVGDPVAFVMDKYGAGVTGSDNANIAAFVAMRLEAIGE